MMMVFRSAPSVSWAISIKDLYDRVGALIIILLTLPFWVSSSFLLLRSDVSNLVFFKISGTILESGR